LIFLQIENKNAFQMVLRIFSLPLSIGNEWLGIIALNFFIYLELRVAKWDFHQNVISADLRTENSMA
jgi:hypothetical protein